MNNFLPPDIQERIDAQLREMVAVAEADVTAGRVATFDREDVKRDVHERLQKRGIRE